MQKFTAKGKKLYFGIVHLKKAFDRILREVKDGNAKVGT